MNHARAVTEVQFRNVGYNPPNDGQTHTTPLPEILCAAVDRSPSVHDISVPLSVRVMTEVVMASSMAGLLLTTRFPVASRIEIRPFSETRSVLEYLRKLSAKLHRNGDDKRRKSHNFPRIDVLRK